MPTEHRHDGLGDRIPNQVWGQVGEHRGEAVEQFGFAGQY
jgi:hypothetical protein